MDAWPPGGKSLDRVDVSGRGAAYRLVRVLRTCGNGGGAPEVRAGCPAWIQVVEAWIRTVREREEDARKVGGLEHCSD